MNYHLSALNATEMYMLLFTFHPIKLCYSCKLVWLELQFYHYFLLQNITSIVFFINNIIVAFYPLLFAFDIVFAILICSMLHFKTDKKARQVFYSDAGYV